MSHDAIDAKEIPHILENGGLLIDVRTPSEFRAAHVKGAELHPLDQLDPAALAQDNQSNRHVYILCQSGKRASIAARKLTQAGHTNIHVIDGGTEAAKAAGLEIVHGEGTISIERQTRMAAGILIVLGGLAAIFINSGFIAVPILIGAGLFFAGATDSCAMGMILTKMPWNR